jgi:4-hydroxy 2-oxovalerate aldolase
VTAKEDLLSERDVLITDSTLRDGSHAQMHKFTAEQVRDVVQVLDAAGVPVIEVAHGDGLGGSSFNYGFSAEEELKLIATAVEAANSASIAVLLLPGVGTVDDMRAAQDLGVQIVRLATHCTEADVSIQHFGVARELGLETVGFLMLSHMVSPEALAEQAGIMVDAGAQCVYVVDSAGALLMQDAAARIQALVTRIGPHARVGYHGHNNLALGVANSLIAVNNGATEIDGATCGLGAGAGNAYTEILVTVFDRLGVRTGIDRRRMLDCAEDIVRPLMLRPPLMDRDAVVMGYSGVYSSFLLHAKRAAERYGVRSDEILEVAGSRRYVGGQEDLLLDIAIGLAEHHREDQRVG